MMDLKPSQPRLNGLMVVSEERNLWVKGKLVCAEEVTVELGFEPGGTPFPGTNLSYIGMWSRDRRKKKTIIEFQLGVLCVKPTADDWENLVRPLIERLQGFMPMRVNIGINRLP